MHGNDPAEFAGRHHLARLPDHGVAGVVERHDEPAVFRARQRHQRLGLGQRRRQRLVADHVDAGFEERGGDRRVQMVGRDDNDGFDAVGPRGFRLRHRAIVGIAALRRDADLGGGCGCVFGVRGQRAGNQRDLVVEPHGQPVHGADEGVAAAAHHADPQAFAHRSVSDCIDHDSEHPPEKSALTSPGTIGWPLPIFEHYFQFLFCKTIVPR